MAPDKIYVRQYRDGDTSGFWDDEPYEDEIAGIEAVEFIRKDALLEYLEKVAAKYKKRSDEGELVWQHMCGIKEAINIINEM